MGLDMIYGISNIPEKDLVILSSKLDKIGLEPHVSIEDRTLSIYYSLNWIGVKYERDLLIYSFLMDKADTNRQKNIDECNDENYLFIQTLDDPSNIPSIYTVKSFKDLIVKNKITSYIAYDLEYIKSLSLNLKENIPFFSGIEMITFKSWKGSNGESIVFNKKESFHGKKMIILNKKGKKQLIEKKEFIPTVSSSFSDKKIDVADYKKAIKNSQEYIDLLYAKKKESYITKHTKGISEIFKIFFELEKNNKEISLFAYMG